MKYIDSGDYSKFGKVNLSEIEAPAQVLKELQEEKERAQILHKIEVTTNAKLAVVIEGGPPRMAACIDTSTHEKYIRREMLTTVNLPFAIYAARHEGQHQKNKFFHLDIKEHLSPHQIQSLENRLNVPDLPEIDLVEGFNDLITSDKFGANDNSGYMDKEVPVAMKLERLGLEKIGVSLKEIFDSGNQELFFKKLVELGEKLLLEQEIEKVLNAGQEKLQKADLMKNTVRKEIFDHFRSSSLEVEKRDEMQTIIKRNLDELVQIASLRKFLQQSPANQNEALKVA